MFVPQWNVFAREAYRQAWRRSKQEELTAVEALSPSEIRAFVEQRERQAAVVLQSAYRRKQAVRRVRHMANVSRRSNRLLFSVHICDFYPRLLCAF